MMADPCQLQPTRSNDDCGSSSSEADDGSFSKSKQHHQQHQTLRRRKGLSVRFPEAYEDMAQVVCEIEPCMNMTDDDRKSLWFTRSDYHFSRSTARVISKESERYGHSKQLDGAYVATFAGHVQDALNLWARHGHSRRGLERWANSHHGNVRKDDQYLYQQGVLRAQQELKLKGGTATSAQPSSSSPTRTEERLREVGHVLSCKARLFAQMLGEADAHAAQWEYGMMMHAHYHPAVAASRSAIAAAVTAATMNLHSNGMMATMVPMVPPRRRNLGLSESPAANATKVNRVSDLPAPRGGTSRMLSHHQRQPPPGRPSGTEPVVGGGAADAPSGRISPKFTIKTRAAGRVPRMA